MNQFQSYITAAGTCLALALTLTLFAQTRETSIEIKGTASQVDGKAGTFVMEGLKITTSEATKYEDRQDRTVNREKFFSDLRATDRLDVEGRLSDSTVSAEKIEIED